MLGKNRIQSIQKLHQKKYRLQEKRFIAEGTKTVLELIKQGFPIESIVATADWIKQHIPENQELICVEAEKFELEKISCLQTTPDVLAVCELNQVTPQKIDAGQLTLVVDAIRDPGNLGTIIRLADWFGVPQILATEDTVEWSNPKCIQASMGSFIRLQPCYMQVRLLSRTPMILALKCSWTHAGLSRRKSGDRYPLKPPDFYALVSLVVEVLFCKQGVEVRFLPGAHKT